MISLQLRQPLRRALTTAILLAGAACSRHGHLMPDPDKVCIAHRGASAYAPEHTLAAYRLALEMNADYVEQDLQLTKDGVLVCLHDTSLERTTNVDEVFPDRATSDARTGRPTWLVVDFKLDEIKTLDAGSWFGPQFAGERIPTFQEAIDLVKGKAGIYPELKAPGFYDDRGFEMEAEVHRVLSANGLDTPKGQESTPVLLQSFSPESLRRMHAVAPDTYRLIQLVTPDQAEELMSDAALPEVARLCHGMGPSLRILTDDPSRVAAAHAAGLTLHPYTVNASRLPEGFTDTRQYVESLLYETGVDGLFIDNPDLFVRR